MAVCAILIVRDRAQSWVLLQKRGPGCPDYVGAWSHTCGYLDYDETIRGALEREILEELGIDITAPDVRVTEHSRNDQPAADPRQNVTFRYVVEIPRSLLGDINLDSEARGGESGEVSDVALHDVSGGVPKLDYAFNHRELTAEILSDTRFFPDATEKKLYAAMSNAESGSWDLHGHRVIWILTRTPGGRVHVVIESLDIDTYWSENTPVYVQEVILRELAQRKAKSHFDDLSRANGPEYVWGTFGKKSMTVKDALEAIESDTVIPGTDVNPIDDFLLV